MKRSNFSDRQIAVALQQIDEGISVGKICWKLGSCEQTYYRWRNKYGGLVPSELKILLRRFFLMISVLV